MIDAIVMMDPMNPMKSRCFGFVTFDPEQDGAHAAASAIAQQPIQVHGRNVEIKLATPRAEQPQPSSNHPAQGFRNNHSYSPNNPFVPPVAKNVGLRAGLTSSIGGATSGMTSSTSNSVYSGLAVAYGRNGWKAGYGSIAFNGPYGWNVWTLDEPPQGTTTETKTNIGMIPERIGFSFAMLQPPPQPSKVKIEDDDTTRIDESGAASNKRARY